MVILVGSLETMVSHMRHNATPAPESMDYQMVPVVG